MFALKIGWLQQDKEMAGAKCPCLVYVYLTTEE
jgi:hypothetical protein